MIKTKIFCLGLLCLVFLTTKAIANQPQVLVATIEKPCESNNPRVITGSMRVKNITEMTLELRTEDLQNRDYDFSFISSKRVLQPNEETIIAYRGSIHNDGKYQINAKIFAEVDGEVVGSHLIDMYYLVEKGQLLVTDYEHLFMQREEHDQVMGDAFLSISDDGQIKRSNDYKQRMPSVQKMIEMDPLSINRIPTRSFGPGCDKDCAEQLLKYKNHTLKDYDEVDPYSIEYNKITPKGLISAKGEFNYKGMDNLLHPAFGWRVKAWKRVAGLAWIVVAEDWIQWDGKWALNIIDGPGEVRFQYVAFNRFFTPVTSADDTYRWVGPIRSSLNSPHNEGSWNADTSGGAVRGLGEIYREGMVLWSKLYWEGGISPLRASSIKVYFPNTSYDCGAGTGVPWSCANAGGTIWLIPSHASRNGVMQHELSHQINYQYWAGITPPGSGGMHSLGSCYNSGLAIMEGFANFMVFWTQSDRGGDPSMGFDFRVENPSFACADPKNINESWVAANFWDLHDSHGDGTDNLWFIHPGAVPGIFLRTGMKAGMASFYPIYRNAANSEHRSIIDNIFKQNNIIE
jgi:hypothetical protein